MAVQCLKYYHEIKNEIVLFYEPAGVFPGQTEVNMPRNAHGNQPGLTSRYYLNR